MWLDLSAIELRGCILAFFIYFPYYMYCVAVGSGGVLALGHVTSAVGISRLQRSIVSHTDASHASLSDTTHTLYIECLDSHYRAS